jgi:ABC-type antimicrobial peptide transport system permease subunit
MILKGLLRRKTRTLLTMAGWVQASFSIALFAQALVTAFVLGAAGGAYPSWRASLMRPVEALRYE